MANLDLPHISSSASQSTAYNLDQVGGAGGWASGGQGALQSTMLLGHPDVARERRLSQASFDANQHWQTEAIKLSQSIKEAAVKVIPMTQRRLVQVFIADPDENVPLDKSLIYSGEQKLTDATNEELFHEIEISRILKEHNTYRITLTNKKVKERVEQLEPARIRDLKMVVVEV